MNLIRKSFWFVMFACLLQLNIPVTGLTATPETSEKAVELLSPTKDHIRISKDIVHQLSRRHYLKISLDDRFSSKVLNRYLDELDPSHSYFYADDIKEFEKKYSFKLDNAFKNNDFKPAFEIFNRYQQRVIERLTNLLARLERGLNDMQFDIDETLRIDRKGLPWPSNEEAMDDLWRKRLKSNVINLKLTGKTLEEIEEILLKRYRNQLNRVKQNTSDDAFEFYMNSLALSVDPHTLYFSPHRTENFNINMSLSLEGIGAVLQMEDEYTKVVRLIPGGPAERSKLLKASDRIVGVAQGANGELLDVVGWRLDEVVNKIRGPKGTLIRLEIIPADTVDNHQTKVINIVRDKVKLEEQAAQKKVIEIQRGSKTYKFGVIDIPTFYADFKGMHQGNPDYKSTTKDVQRIIAELVEEGAKGLIIDLRDNGGGSLQEANTLAGLFIGLGPTVQVRSANRRIDIIRDHDPQLIYSGPIVVLVNRMSASASEIFAGAMQDYQRGIILGDPTFGKGTVQSLFPLSRGQLKATTAKFYRISGQSTQNRGISPDLIFPSLYNADKTGESSLEDALRWDKINSIPFQTYYQMDKYMPMLELSYEKRLKTNPHYSYTNERLNKIKEMGSKKEISLSEKTRKEERLEADRWRLEIENKLRQSKGQGGLTSIKELEKSEEDPHGNKKSEDDDFLHLEAGEILVDFIRMLPGNIAKNKNN